MRLPSLLCILCLAATSASAAEPVAAPPKLADVVELPSPGDVQLDGWLGHRVALNASERLAKVDLEPLLAGFRHKPGTHPWIGEHIGKWMHAATLAWANNRDAELRKKLDYAAAELVKAQEPDGYLGTYVPEKRFGLYPGADWDVWSHKYCLIGLLTYHQYTGDAASLAACRRAGDLLLATFGPDKKSILSAGTHMGMAATSVLEPMVLLYRSTGDARYLEFCHYLIRSWSEPNGPKILESLGAGQPVDKTANAKAYEMTSNLVGLCELVRQTGDRELLKPLLHAWSDIVAHQLYITGTASYGEHFFGDHDRRYLATGPIGEACVTVTWMQFNLQLLRLTGEARFGEELERSLYNHLAGSQRPDGQQWCYFTPLEGKKPYHGSTTCCLSSGPRGMALAPTLACFTTRRDNADYVGINLLETFRAKLTIAGQPVTIQQQSAFPYSGGLSLTFHPERPVTFGLLVRVPAWTQGLRLKDTAVAGSVRDGWMAVAPREWKDGDQLPVAFDLRAEIVKTDQEKPRRVALHWGPMVLAYDIDHNPGSPAFNSLVLAAASDRPMAMLQSKTGGELTFEALVRSLRGPDTPPMRGAVLVPFADAGAKGGLYSVWLRAPGSTPSSVESLLAFAHESRSREGNVAGSICDGSPESYVVTFNGSKSEEDWFAVAVDEPITVRRIVFTHGKIYHDGGWFDASAGKPRVQIRGAKDADWETIGPLDTYPATTAVNPAQLTTGQTFTLRLSEPVRAVAVRVIGRPACGDNPAQAFSSCGELEAFAGE